VGDCRTADPEQQSELPARLPAAIIETFVTIPISTWPNMGDPPAVVEILEYVFDLLIEAEKLPSALREHRLSKRSARWGGFTECHLGPDLLLIYRVRRHRQLFSTPRLRNRNPRKSK
jgi:addiction module RelE/StbE family toxin